MDVDFQNLKKRIDKYGITITEPSIHTQNIGRKTNYIVFNNRKRHKAVIIDEKKLKSLLNTKHL